MKLLRDIHSHAYSSLGCMLSYELNANFRVLINHIGVEFYILIAIILLPAQYNFWSMIAHDAKYHLGKTILEFIRFSRSRQKIFGIIWHWNI